mgnify:CR=1 FL=1
MLIIAEIGVNWDGDFQLLKKMLQKAKSVGCDLVKFQAFTKEMIKDHPESDRLMKSSISTKNIQQINDLSNEIGIEWFCTPMYPEAVDFLNPYVKRFKIREFDSRPLFDNSSTPLFEKILKTGKEIFISTEKLPFKLDYYNNPKINWLYCIPKYPCLIDEIDFEKIHKIGGFSNHCPLSDALIKAVEAGATILEVHVTFDKQKNFIDNNVSFDFNELEMIIKTINKKTSNTSCD